MRSDDLLRVMGSGVVEEMMMMITVQKGEPHFSESSQQQQRGIKKLLQQSMFISVQYEKW